MNRPQAWFRVVIVLAASLSGCASATTHSAAAPRSSAPRLTDHETERESGPTEAAPCDGLNLQLGRLRVSQRWNIKRHKCIVMVASDGKNGKARSYLFNSEGMLMTYSVLGPGPVSKATGARTHLLLPNVQKLRVESKGPKLLVHTTSGHTVTFDGVTGAPEGISGGEFRVERTPSTKDGGGVTLRTDSGVVVDFGFTRGASPHENPEGSATVSDARGRECTVRNSELLSYDGEEPRVAVSSQADLSAFFASARAGSCGSLTMAAR